MHQGRGEAGRWHLEDVLGADGTLVMPTFSEHLCEPNEMGGTDPPKVRRHRRAHMPLFDRDLTPVDKVNGFLTEVFRKQTGVVRSGHPHVSFAAWGRHAQQVVANHRLDDALGPTSPLQPIYDLQGKTALLGAGTDALTALHLAEYWVPWMLADRMTMSARVAVDGRPEWVEYREVKNNSDVFPALFDDYARQGGRQRAGKVGDARSRLLPVVELVDFGIGWLNTRPAATGAG